MTTNATVEARHKDEAKLSWINPDDMDAYERRFAQALANLEAVRAENADLTNRLAEIDRQPLGKGPHMQLAPASLGQLAGWLRDGARNMEGGWKNVDAFSGMLGGWEHGLMRHVAAELDRIAALASGHTPSPCPSCNGLNISCPEGCERDPLTGELIPWACPGCAAKDEAMEAFKAEVSDAVEAYGRASGIDARNIAYARLTRFIIPPADPVAEALKALIAEHGVEVSEAGFNAMLAWHKGELSRLPLGGAK